MIPLVGFLPPSDPRVVGTVEAVQRELLHDGFVRRYSTRTDVDGLPVGEAAFLVCTLWLADNLALLGRGGEARRLFERVLDLRNDLGLLSEEYDPAARRLVGNFPQALSHVGVINTPPTTWLRLAARPNAVGAPERRTCGGVQYKNPVPSRVRRDRGDSNFVTASAQRSGAGVEPTEPWVARPHRF
jgi:hypothetical protein